MALHVRRAAEASEEEFEQRRQAAEGSTLGDAAGPALRQALAANPPLEAQQRMEDVVRKQVAADDGSCLDAPRNRR